jgi:ABC-type transport system involved in multi-copper enzyme maturation permease subunit
MTASTITTQPPATRPTFRAARFTDVLHSEWTKVRTVRSTIWTLVAAAVLGIGLGALISAIAAHHYSTGSASNRLTWDPTSISSAGMGIAQLAIGVLGVMLITSEYSTGAIAGTLAAVPRRERLLAAKALVLFALLYVFIEIIVFAAFFIGQALISGHAPTATLGDPGVLRALLGSGLYGAGIGLLGLAFGTILRSAAGAISLLVALLFVLPGIAAALPASVEHTIEKFWPTGAGSQIGAVVPTAHTLSPWAGLGVFVGFLAIVSAAALILMKRRDG